MFYAQCPKKTGLPREVVQWLQTLDLSFYPKNLRRDFSNGCLVAEIFSHYYPRDFQLHSYDKGVSLSAKQRNWSQIEQSLRKRGLRLMKDATEGTIHHKPGAAELLLQDVYTILTKSSISGVRRQVSDFTDQEYQEMLPSLARSTATKAIKNNLTITEITANPDIRANQRKAQIILQRHQEHKAAEKRLNPGHFQAKSNKSQLVIKNPRLHNQDERTSKLCSSPTESGAVASCKEIKVHQPVKPILMLKH